MTVEFGEMIDPEINDRRDPDSRNYDLENRDRDMEISEFVPDPEYLEYLQHDHPCEGCPAIISNGDMLCPECEASYLVYQGHD